MVLAWKGQVHGFNELLDCQVADLLVPCQLVKWSPTVWAGFALVFVKALIAEEMAILALDDVPLFRDMETDDALVNILNLFLVLCLRFPDGLLPGFLANPLQLRL